MNMLYHRFEIADEKTGEIYEDYPTLESFMEQLEGFFRDDWVVKEKAFKFNVFMGKGYGGWNKVTIKPKPQVQRFTPPPPVQDTGKIHQLLADAGFGKKEVKPDYLCDKCGKVHSVKFICANP
jgi:hypothetical protein